MIQKSILTLCKNNDILNLCLIMFVNKERKCYMMSANEFESFMNFVENAKYVVLKFKKETNGEIVEKMVSFSDLSDSDKKSNQSNYVKNSFIPLIFKSKTDKDSYRSCYFSNIISYSEG